MKHDPADSAHGVPDALVDGDFGQHLDAVLAALPPCPAVPSTPKEFAASVARSRADVAAGRVHSHTVVGEWLKTLGLPGYRPFRDWLAERDG